MFCITRINWNEITGACVLIASYIAVWRWPPLHAIVRIPIWFFFSLLFFYYFIFFSFAEPHSAPYAVTTLNGYASIPTPCWRLFSTQLAVFLYASAGALRSLHRQMDCMIVSSNWTRPNYFIVIARKHTAHTYSCGKWIERIDKIIADMQTHCRRRVAHAVNFQSQFEIILHVVCGGDTLLLYTSPSTPIITLNFFFLLLVSVCVCVWD